jgi:hypothetical protein
MVAALTQSTPYDLVALSRKGVATPNAEIVIDDYCPSPTPQYEAGGWPRAAEFLRDTGDDKIIKIFFDDIVNIPRGSHKIIFMDRDEEEINRSLEMVDEHYEKLIKVLGRKPERQGPTPPYVRAFDVYRPYNKDDIEHVIGIMKCRRDVQLIRVNYGDLIKDPAKEFSRIAEILDLDVEEAASMIDAKHYRAKSNEGRHGRRSADSIDRNTEGRAESVTGGLRAVL